MFKDLAWEIAKDLEVGENSSHAQNGNASQVDREGKRTPSDFGKSKNSSYQKGQEFPFRRLLDLVNVGNPEQIRPGSMILLSKVFFCLRLFFENHGPFHELPRDAFFFTKTTPCCFATKNRRSKQQQVLNLSKISCQMEVGDACFRYR